MYDALKIGRLDCCRRRARPFGARSNETATLSLPTRLKSSTIPFSGLGTTIDRISSNRAQVKRMLKAEIEALRLIKGNPAATTEVIRKRFNMDEKMARESYDVVVDAFSRDGRVPLEGVEILLGIEKAPSKFHKTSPRRWSWTTPWRKRR